MAELTPQIDLDIARIAEAAAPAIDRFTSSVIDRLSQREPEEDEAPLSREEERKLAR